MALSCICARIAQESGLRDAAERPLRLRAKSTFSCLACSEIEYQNDFERRQRIEYRKLYVLSLGPMLIV